MDGYNIHLIFNLLLDGRDLQMGGGAVIRRSVGGSAFMLYWLTWLHAYLLFLVFLASKISKWRGRAAAETMDGGGVLFLGVGLYLFFLAITGWSVGAQGWAGRLISWGVAWWGKEDAGCIKWMICIYVSYGWMQVCKEWFNDMFYASICSEMGEGVSW